MSNYGLGEKPDNIDTRLYKIISSRSHEDYFYFHTTSQYISFKLHLKTLICHYFSLNCNSCEMHWVYSMPSKLEKLQATAAKNVCFQNPPCFTCKVNMPLFIFKKQFIKKVLHWLNASKTLKANTCSSPYTLDYLSQKCSNHLAWRFM